MIERSFHMHRDTNEMNQREAGIAAEGDARLLRLNILYRVMQIKEGCFKEIYGEVCAEIERGLTDRPSN